MENISCGDVLVKMGKNKKAVSIVYKSMRFDSSVGNRRDNTGVRFRNGFCGSIIAFDHPSEIDNASDVQLVVVDVDRKEFLFSCEDICCQMVTIFLNGHKYLLPFVGGSNDKKL